LNRSHARTIPPTLIQAEDDVVRLKEEMADCRVQNKAWREQWKQRATNFTLMMIRNEACG
jgi:hypothetical protein